MREKITFTTARLQAMQPPNSGRQYIYDAKTAGLAICITAAGGKTFYFYRWSAGKPVRIRLGKFSDLSIDQARKAAAEFTGEQAKGVDLAAERRAKRQEQTLKELWGDWLEVHAKPRKRTWKDDERQWKKYIADTFGTRRLSSLRTSELAKWHAKIGKDSGQQLPFSQLKTSFHRLPPSSNTSVRKVLIQNDLCLVNTG